MLATGLWEKTRRMRVGVGWFLEYYHPVIGPTLTAYTGEARERRPERWLPPFLGKLFCLLSGKPAVSSTASHAVAPSPRHPGCWFSLFSLILTRTLAQAFSLEGSGDFLQQLSPGHNIPREHPSSGGGQSETYFQHTKEQPVLAKFSCTFRKVYPCASWVKKRTFWDCVDLSNLATVLPMIHRCGIFTGATAAGLYISFADEGMITAAVWNNNN